MRTPCLALTCVQWCRRATTCKTAYITGGLRVGQGLALWVQSRLAEVLGASILASPAVAANTSLGKVCSLRGSEAFLPHSNVGAKSSAATSAVAASHGGHTPHTS